MLFQTIHTGNMSSIIQLNESAFLRLGNLPIRDQCNTGILVTKDGIVLIDFPKQEPADEIISETESLFHKKVTHIFFTHAHGDHRNGLAGLVGEEILLLCSKAGAEELKSCYPRLSSQIQALNNGKAVTVGGMHFHMNIPPKLPAHSPWDMLISCEEYHLLFMGDFLNPPDTLYFHSSNYQNWVSSLSAMWDSFSSRLLIPGHGLPWTREESSVSFRYIADLGKIFEALQEKGICESSISKVSDLFRLLPQERKRLHSLECAAGQHMLRQLREMAQASAQSF